MTDIVCWSTPFSSWSKQSTGRLAQKGHDAYDVVDNVASEESFVQKLLVELHPWLQQLSAAKTEGDKTLETVLALIQHKEKDVVQSVRGDRSIFLPAEAFVGHDTSTGHTPRLARLKSLVRDAVHLQLRGAVQFSTKISVQLAVYPGDGVSGYVRHCDRERSICRDEHLSLVEGSYDDETPQRMVTAIYYLTPEDWSEEDDGGHLRLFASESRDVAPLPNRMVVFRSDSVEHEVLPSKRRERTALTMWFYGRPLQANIPPALLTHSESSMTADKTIFVSIVSYRDSETAPTIRHLFETAAERTRVRVGLVLQIDPHYDQDIADSIRALGVPRDQLRNLQMDAKDAAGPCYARALCQEKLFANEDYFMQIDSHMRFRRNWDTYLIEQLEAMNKEDDKTMLTAYPVGYALPNKIPNETRGTLLVPWKFDDDGYLRQRGRLMKVRRRPGELVPTYFYAAGFNFSRGQVVKDVPYDPTLRHLFFGEELSMALRLYLSGYNVYAPNETVLYHLWSRSHRPTHASDVQMDPELVRRAQEEKSLSMDKLKKQMAGKDIRGTSPGRTVEDFWKALGVEGSALKEGFDTGVLTANDFVDTDIATLQPGSLQHRVAVLDSNAQDVIVSFLKGMA